MSEIELHRKLLGDHARNAAFHRALQQRITPGRTKVLDIGGGTGFLSFLARKLGAADVTMIEYSDALELAEELARRNRIDGLSFVRAHSIEWRRKLNVDLVVTETLGNYALEENFLETAIDARRFLKADGHIIPGRLRQYVAPVLRSRLQSEIDIWPDVGYELDLTPARTISLNNMYVRDIVPDDVGAAPQLAQCWDDLDVRPGRRVPDSHRRSTTTWTAEALPGARVDGFALWWEAELIEGVSISTSPYDAPTHWQQIYLPLLQPHTLQHGDQLELSLSSDTRPEVGVRVGWKTRQLRGGKVVGAQSLDSLRGQL
ncbi:methyltransferase domain-containing protein [Solimonas marina]|uniref:Methyltransferase domain-containing protein n=1 Tax=Solimonas marina TaxID=2714601 RepID=A0A969W817_9GAMM|nr:methyltransferase domain-containing protein [Solimonas marina]NKF22337.1 methyltransferase domain-containing protein [Solimonas marina]